ncbi:MAG: NYN domain-containing protein [Planctomycetota bacterium]
MHAAVFVDFENLYLSLKSRNDGTGVRTRELSLQILEGMLARLRKKGHPMVIGRSYAAFDSYPGVEVAHDLALMGLDPQYVLISHSGKNSADVQLALDVARVVFRRADIDLIVIVSGDRDFIPLARQVLEEGRELRIVAIPDTTSGDLRERVGEERFVDALELIQSRINLSKPPTSHGPPPRDDGEHASAVHQRVAAEHPAMVNGEAVEAMPSVAEPAKSDECAEPTGPTIVGHVPVTWQTQRSVTPEEHEDRLQQCLEMLVRTRLRHNSPDIWLSPFLKGPMSQHFSNLVHPERRALINELRNRGVIRVEERENAYADHPYSVIVIEEDHPMAQAAWDRTTRGYR